MSRGGSTVIQFLLNHKSLKRRLLGRGEAGVLENSQGHTPLRTPVTVLSYSLNSVLMDVPLQEILEQYLNYGGRCKGGIFSMDCKRASLKAASALEAGTIV